MKITSIKQQAKNPERVSVFVDGKYSFSLSLDELVKEKLKNGDELDVSRVGQLKKISEDGKLRARALEWLMNRPHSTKEFKDYMRRKKADPKLIDELVEEFTQKGYLNEADFGRWLVELRQRAGKSDRAIKAELFKKGLPRAVVEEILVKDEEAELMRIKLIISKKGNQSRYANDPQKLAQFLARQGFDWPLIKQALALNQPED
jgi:regulatory protein